MGVLDPGAVPEPGAAIINDVHSPATLIANHGGQGTILWKRLVTGGHMYGAWESFEYARMQPDAAVGRHEHSRTKEVYFVLSGAGILEVDGVEGPLAAGEAAVTPLGSVHAFRPADDEPVDFLVIETLPPQIVAALPGRRPTVDGPTSGAEPTVARAATSDGSHAATADGRQGVHAAGVAVRSIDVSALQADWRSLNVLTLAPDSRLGPRRLESSEIIAYVMSGTVVVTLPDGPRELAAGSVLALPWGGVWQVENRGGQPADLVIAELGAG